MQWHFFKMGWDYCLCYGRNQRLWRNLVHIPFDFSTPRGQTMFCSPPLFDPNLMFFYMFNLDVGWFTRLRAKIARYRNFCVARHKTRESFPPPFLRLSCAQGLCVHIFGRKWTFFYTLSGGKWTPLWAFWGKVGLEGSMGMCPWKILKNLIDNVTHRDIKIQIVIDETFSTLLTILETLTSHMYSIFIEPYKLMKLFWLLPKHQIQSYISIR